MSEGVECPHCGELFDVSEQMRTHIEKSVRSEMSQKIRTELEKTYESRLDDKLKNSIDEIQHLESSLKEIRGERNELKDSKRELERLKEDQEQLLKDAVAESTRKARRDLNAELGEKIDERVKEETGDKTLEIEKLRLQLERQNQKVEELQEASTRQHGELQGEALEKAVLENLSSWHPLDKLNEIARGNYGADIEQFVRTNQGTTAGKILYECKYHKKWNDGWVEKIRKDGTGFDVLVIVTTTMPDRMEHFGEVDGVFVCRFHELLVVSNLLRFAVLRSNSLVVKEAHKESIQERVVEYIGSPEFNFVMTNIMNAYNDFDDSIRKEEQYMKKLWKARRTKLQTVSDSMAEMLGKLEAIGGATFKEIGFERPLLDEPEEFTDDGE